MTTKKINQIIILFMIGFSLIVLNFYVNTSLQYPKEYKNDSNIIGEFQYYSIHTFFGATCTYKTADEMYDDSVVTPNANSSAMIANAEFVDEVFFDGIRVDIFNDIIGLLLILFACLSLRKYRKLFAFSSICVFICLILKIALSALPFGFNGMTLCNLALGVGISYTLALIVSTYFAVKGFISLIQDSCCRDERLWLNTGWFVYMVLAILVLLLRWLDLQSMSVFFMVVQFIDVMVMGMLLIRVKEFVARNAG